MALQLSITTEYGINVPNAYVRVGVTSLPVKDTLHFEVCGYVSQEHPPILKSYYTCSHDLEGPNPIKQAYLHLKSLPEFADAVDC
jgi:hypothetical protein